MRILIVDGPGLHPVFYPRVLGGALHRRGHAVIVHPARDVSSSWPARHAFRRRAKEVLSVHQPDVVHVVSREPWIAEAFAAQGVPLIHSGEGRTARADWCVVPTAAALNAAAGNGAGPDFRVGLLPYAFDIAEKSSGPGDFALAFVPPGDASARRVFADLCQALPRIPFRAEGDPAAARFVVALGSDPAAWPAGMGEAMGAGRPVLASWEGCARDFVLEGVTGFLSAPGDVRSLALQSEVLWDRPGDAQRMGDEALKHAREHFAPDDHAKILLRWYLRAGASRIAV